MPANSPPQDAHFDLSITIQDFLATGSEAVQFAIRNGMGCVGCRMAGFCTLGEALELYGLNRPELMDEINQLVMKLTIKPYLN